MRVIGRRAGWVGGGVNGISGLVVGDYCFTWDLFLPTDSPCHKQLLCYADRNENPSIFACSNLPHAKNDAKYCYSEYK